MGLARSVPAWHVDRPWLVFISAAMRKKAQSMKKPSAKGHLSPNPLRELLSTYRMNILRAIGYLSR